MVFNYDKMKLDKGFDRMFSKYKEKKNRKYFKEMSYYDSLDYELSLQLKKYQIDTQGVIVWYYHKEKEIILFQKNQKYYHLEKGNLKEISDKEIWEKSR